MTTLELFNSGDLDGAIERSLARVREAPDDVTARGKLAELLCFTGDWTRADKQLAAVARVTNDDRLQSIAEFRQLVAAAVWRDEVFAAGRSPEFVGSPPESAREALRALVELRAGDAAAAVAALEASFASRLPVSGKLDGRPFADFRDLQPLTAGCLEALAVTGKYYWLPFETVRAVTFEKPEFMRDRLWRAATVDFVDGTEGKLFVPLHYVAGDAPSADVRLGKVTEPADDPNPLVRLRGRRVFRVDGDEIDAGAITDLTFDRNAEAADETAAS